MARPRPRSSHLFAMAAYLPLFFLIVALVVAEDNKCALQLKGPLHYKQTGAFVKAYSNTDGVTDSNGEDVPVRTILDDFEVPPREVWTIETFSWQHVWLNKKITSPAGSGVKLSLRVDDKGAPGGIFLNANINGENYSEVATGKTYKDRMVMNSTASFDSSFNLTSGVYWFEASVIGPDNNFWFVFNSLDKKESQGWLNYQEYVSGLSTISDAGVDEIGGLEYPSTHSFNFVLEGATSVCSPGMPGASKPSKRLQIP